MKKRLLSITLLSLALALPLHASEITDDPKGFKQIPWGSTFKETTRQTGSLKKMAQNHKMTYYTPRKKDEDHTYRDASFSDIAYAFHDEHGLYLVALLDGDGEETYQKLEQALTSLYGDCKVTAPYKAWTNGDTLICLRYDVPQQKTKCFFLSQPIRDSLTEQTKAQIRKDIEQ